MQLKTDRAEPAYRQLMERLKDEIDTGKYSVGDRIPTESELCADFGVSRITVRRAVEELEIEGCLIKKQGKGTFVTIPKKKPEINKPDDFFELCRQRSVQPKAKLIKAGIVPASEKDIKNLQLLPNSKVVVIRRLLSADGLPVILEECHFPTAYSYILESRLTESLYKALKMYGIEPGINLNEISIIESDLEQSEILQIKNKTPLIFHSKIVYDMNGRILNTTEQYIRGEEFSVII